MGRKADRNQETWTRKTRRMSKLGLFIRDLAPTVPHSGNSIDAAVMTTTVNLPILNDEHIRHLVVTPTRGG